MATRSPAGPAEAARDLIAQAIADDGRDQKDIAAAADMSAAQLSRLKTGERPPTVPVAMDLEAALGHVIPDGVLVDLARDVRRANLAARKRNDPGLLRSLGFLLFPEHSPNPLTRTPHAPALAGA